MADWDLFSVVIDDRRAVIAVDLEAGTSGDHAARPWFVWVRVELRTAREDGLLAREERPAIDAFEDQVVPIIEAASGQFVARRVHGGRRDWFFYLPAEPASPLIEAIRRRAQDHGYAAEVLFGNEPDWRTFHESIEPLPEERQTIQDRRVLAHLAELGDDSSVIRGVDHWVYFADSLARDAFGRRASEHGYAVRSTRDDATEPRRHGIQVSRDQPADEESITTAVRVLYRLALELNGDYDGWETSVQQPDTRPGPSGRGSSGS